MDLRGQTEALRHSCALFILHESVSGKDSFISNRKNLLLELVLNQTNAVSNKQIESWNQEPNDNLTSANNWLCDAGKVSFLYLGFLVCLLITISLEYCEEICST